MNIAKLIREPLPVLPVFAVAPEAEQARNELVLAAAQFQVAMTAAQANSLGEAARDLRTYIAGVKAQNLAWRRPVNDALARILALEKEHLAPAIAEQERCERVAGAWAAGETRRIETERVARQAELDRLETARLEALSLATASDSPEDIKAARELADAAAATLDAALRAPLPEPVKIGGMTTKQKLCFEVLDIHALYKARPELVRMEPKASAILSTCFPEEPVAGLRLWYEDATSTRKW